MSWSTEVLCVDADLLEFESNVLSWTKTRGSCEKWRDKAKYVIGQRLRYAFRATQVGTDTDVLDLVLDTTPLKDAACFMALHLLCNDATTGEDAWSSKAEMYWSKFADEWPIALGLLSLDIDESGTIEQGEYYNVPDVTLERGI